MKPFAAIILSLFSGAIGFFVGAFCLDIAGGMISCTVITMGACIIHTINKNFSDLRKDLKDQSKKNE